MSIRQVKWESMEKHQAEIGIPSYLWKGGENNYLLNFQVLDGVTNP